MVYRFNMWKDSKMMTTVKLDNTFIDSNARSAIVSTNQESCKCGVHWLHRACGFCQTDLFPFSSIHSFSLPEMPMASSVSHSVTVTFLDASVSDICLSVPAPFCPIQPSKTTFKFIHTATDDKDS